MIINADMIDTLQSSPLFRSLSSASIRDICRLAIHRRISRHDTLFFQSEKARHFYLLTQGQIKLSRSISGGIEKVVEVIMPGGTFADDAVLSRHTRHFVTATALQPSELICIDAAHFRQVLQEYPHLCLEVLDAITERLQRYLEEIDTLITPNVNRRVAKFLQDQRSDGTSTVQLKVPKRLVASQLGLTPETLSRILHRLMASGIIEMNNRRIDIVDHQSLVAFCE